MTKTLEQLDSEAQKASSAAATARDALDRAQAEAAQQRQDRLDAWDQQQADAYVPGSLAQGVADAKQAVTDAILADPVWSAVIELGVAQRRVVHRWQAMGGGGQAPPPIDPIGWDQLSNLLDRTASNRAEDELDARARAREAAGDAPS